MVDTSLCAFEIGRKEKEKKQKQKQNRTEASNLKRTLEFSLMFFIFFLLPSMVLCLIML